MAGGGRSPQGGLPLAAWRWIAPRPWTAWTQLCWARRRPPPFGHRPCGRIVAPTVHPAYGSRVRDVHALHRPAAVARQPGRSLRTAQHMTADAFPDGRQCRSLPLAAESARFNQAQSRALIGTRQAGPAVRPNGLPSLPMRVLGLIFLRRLRSAGQERPALRLRHKRHSPPAIRKRGPTPAVAPRLRTARCREAASPAAPGAVSRWGPSI